jgi:hypothetical protein
MTNQTNRTNQMKPALHPTYFPFTYIAPSLVEALADCLDGIVVYQPPGGVPTKGLQGWIARGFLRLPSFPSDPTRQEALTKELRAWKAWGLMHENADLTYLKHVRHKIAPAGPLTPALVSQIKDRTGKIRQDPQGDKDLASLLFVHLAHDFDRESVELQEQLAEVRKQKESLQTFFSLDASDEEPLFEANDPFTEVSEDLGAVMTRKRMIVWNHLFQTAAPDADIFLTDSAAAHAFVLEHAKGHVEVAHIETVAGGGSPHPLPWRDRLQDFLRTLLVTPWNNRVREEAQETVNRIREMITGDLNGPSVSGRSRVSLRWHLVPSVSGKALLNRACSPGGITQAGQGAATNTLVGLFSRHP